MRVIFIENQTKKDYTVTMSTEVKGQLPVDIMKKAVRGMTYMAHPLRLRILEYLDIKGSSCVSDITKAVREEQMIVSQSLRKLRDAKLVRTERHGIFIYYKIHEEYPASLFVCIRKLYGYMTNDFRYLVDGNKLPLPRDFTLLIANQIKLFAHFDKMRILEYLIYKESANVSDIATGIEQDPVKTSQNLKRLKDDGFVSCRRDGRFIIYEITKGIQKTALECIHKRYNSLKNKLDF